MNKLKLVLATNNSHKAEEIILFIGDKFEILTLEQIGFQGDIEETGATLAENSLLKAEFIYAQFKINCIADDSGLEVYSLNYEPGVYSARYAGKQRDDDDNVNLLLTNLKDKTDRSARFRTVITLILDGKIHQFEGTIKGSITLEKRGSNGFGYDPVFIPENFSHTFAEMSLEEKNDLSHRTQAIKKMVKFLENKDI